MAASRIFFLITAVALALTPAACDRKTAEKPEASVLKIGTVHRAKTDNLLFDDALGLFSLISHPPLLELKPSGEFGGILAETFSYSKDYRIWTFKLKPDLFWSDGKPVTADDVKFTLLYLARHLPSRRWISKTIRRIDIDGDGNIRCSLIKPYTHFDIELTSIRMFPAHIWEGIENPQNWDSPNQFIGCGPFVIKNVDLNAGMVTLVRNPFWKGPAPHLKGIEINMYHNLDILSLAMIRGDVDTYYKYADSFPYENIPPIRETGLYHINRYPQSGFVFLGFNLKKFPLNDLALREAILSSLDFSEMKKLITLDFGEFPTRGLVPSYFKFYHSTQPLIRDINRARLILEKSGYRDIDGDGFLEDPQRKPLELKLISTLLYVRLSELVKDYLGQIGIRIYIQILDPVTWIHAKDRYDYHLTITRTTPWGMMMHAGWSTGYFDCRRTGQGVLHTIEDPEYIQLCDAALATKDPRELILLARRIQEYHSRYIPAVALVAKTDVIPSKVNLTGWHHDPLFGIYNLRTMLHLKRTQ